MIGVEHAKQTLDSESIAGLCSRRSPPPTGRVNATDAVMASKVLASSRIHTNGAYTGSCAEIKHAKQAAYARRNTSWLEKQASLLWPSSLSSELPESSAPIDLREPRVAKIQLELLLTQSILPSKVADRLAPGSGATFTGVARARSQSPATGSISNQRPCRAPTHDVQRTIDVERAERTIEAEDMAGLCIRKSPKTTGGADAIDIIMASRILASSKIHADIMDAVARDLHSRSAPAPSVAVPSAEPSPRRSVCSLRSSERSIARSRLVAMSHKEREEFARSFILEGNVQALGAGH